MPANFYSLPREIRDEIYRYVVAKRGSIEPWDLAHQKLLRSQGMSALLRVNKFIHHEAAYLLYAKNCFNFFFASNEQIQRFCTQIGPVNAGCIETVQISFPMFRCMEPDEAKIRKIDCDTLAIIREAFPNLRTIASSMLKMRPLKHEAASARDLNITAEAFQVVARHFRSVPPLREVIIDIYERIIHPSYGELPELKLRLLELGLRSEINTGLPKRPILDEILSTDEWQSMLPEHNSNDHVVRDDVNNDGGDKACDQVANGGEGLDVNNR